MAKKFKKGISLALLAFLLFSATMLGVYRTVLPNVATVQQAPEYPLLRSTAVFSHADAETNGQIDYRLYGILPVKKTALLREKPRMLYPGGMPFGVKFLTEGVLVVGFCDVNTAKGSVNPAKNAGLKPGDVITEIDSTPLNGSTELTSRIEAGDGKSLSVTYRRDGKQSRATLTPAYSATEGKYKSGMYVRDSGAGIGTVTFIVPDSYAFAGLGHGICDGETGKLLPMQRGSVVGVTISGVVKGLVGAPGEVKGYFSSGKTGSLLGNTECGVYGVFAEKPATIHCDPMPVGKREELKNGKAYIYCTLDEGQAKQYEIEISGINPTATGNKCFTVKVTDKALIAKTGGIIQGMSGSPIIQNGKLVGAVTHVLINDPTMGYGIFIENMLNAAQIPMAKAA